MSLNKQVDGSIKAELIDKDVCPITIVNWCAVDIAEYYDDSFWDRHIFTGRVALANSWKSRRTRFFAVYIPAELRGV